RQRRSGALRQCRGYPPRIAAAHACQYATRLTVRSEGIPFRTFPQGRRGTFGPGAGPTVGYGDSAAAPERPFFWGIVPKRRISAFDHALAGRTGTLGFVLFL